MKKILLIYEDYNESTSVHSLLRKVGFDSYTINNVNRLADQILTFNPDLIVVYGKQKFPGMQVCQKLKEITHLKSKVLLIMPKGERPQAQDMPKVRVDMILEGPLASEQLILASSKLLGVAIAPLLEKYKKFKHSEDVAHSKVSAKNEAGDKTAGIMVSGAKSEEALQGSFIQNRVSLEDKGRIEKYQKLLDGISFDKTKTTHEREAIRKRQAELKKGWDFDFLGKIDKLKRQFVDALFKKK